MYPENGRYLGPDPAQVLPQYVDKTLTRDGRERLRQRTDLNARPKHRESFQRMTELAGLDLDALSTTESDEGKKMELSRNRMHTIDDIVSIEDQIKIRAQKLFEEMLTREKQKEAEAREKEERWKEEDARYKVTLQKALNDQAAVFQKQAENQKLATQAEIGRIRQKEESDKAKFKEAVAAEVEALKKAEREKACKIREKLERDKVEEERRKAQVAQEAEELYTARLRQEADSLAAKRKAEKDKMMAENTAKVFEMTRLLISLFEANETRSDRHVAKNTGSKKSIIFDNESRQLLIQVKKILGEKPESSIGEEKAVVEVEESPKIQELSLDSKVRLKSDVKAESLSIQVKRSDGVSRGAAKHRNNTSSVKTRERNRHQKHAEKDKDGKVHGKQKDESKGKRVSKKSQGRASAAMRWFI